MPDAGSPKIRAVLFSNESCIERNFKNLLSMTENLKKVAKNRQLFFLYPFYLNFFTLGFDIKAYHLLAKV